jgi:hypothetical protein
MSFPGDPTVEEFLDKFVLGDFDINHEDPNTKSLMDALTWYQVGKAAQFIGPLELSKSQARIAISKAMLSGAIKEKGGKRGESPEKNQGKPKIDPLEEVKQEFIKYVQEHPPQPTQNQTATTATAAADNDNNNKGTAKENVTTPVSTSLKVVYDIVENAPPEKKKALNRFLDFIKDNRLIIGQITAQTIGQITGKLIEFVKSYQSPN